MSRLNYTKKNGKHKKKAKFRCGDLVVFVKPWGNFEGDHYVGQIHIIESAVTNDCGESWEYATNQVAWVDEDSLILGVDCTETEEDEEEEECEELED